MTEKYNGECSLSCISCGIVPKEKTADNGRVHYGIIRGLCRDCYNAAKSKIKAGKTSWKKLIKRGKALDSLTKSFNTPKKKCPDCKKVLPVKEFRITRRPFPASYCRKCRNLRSKAHNEKHFFKTRANSWRNGSGHKDVPMEAKALARLWKHQRGKCALSARKLTKENAELDHIIARSKGGSDTIENLRWVCKEANRAKDKLTDEELLLLCNDIILTLTKERRPNDSFCMPYDPV